MKKFSLPVTWSVWDKIEVEAETIEDAVKYVKEHIDEIPLGTEPEYIEGSYKIEDGDDGENDIEETVKFLKEYWNLSGGIDGEEIDDIEVQTLVLSHGVEGDIHLMTLEEFQKEIRDIAKIDSEYYTFIQKLQLTDCKDSQFKFICTKEQRAIYKLDIDASYKYHGVTYQKLIVDSKSIDLDDKLNNMYGCEIDDKVYNLINENRKTLYPEIERYISQNLYKYLNFINEETLRLLEEDLIDEYDWTAGLYNCDELYLRAIIYVLRKER